MSLFLLFMQVSLFNTEIKIIQKNGSVVAGLHSQSAAFGPKASEIYGRLVAINTTYGCSPIQPNVQNLGKIAVIRRGQCSFMDKTLNAQNGWFSGVVIYDPLEDGLIVMNSDVSRVVTIDAFFVSSARYRTILKYCNSSGYRAVFTVDLRNNFELYIFGFACLVGICVLIFILFMFVKLIVHYYQVWKAKLPLRQIKKLPIKQYYPNVSNYFDSCAICLEDFEDRVKIRELPCGHVYHVGCIDPWLIKVHRLCPLCKRDVLKSGEDSPCLEDC